MSRGCCNLRAIAIRTRGEQRRNGAAAVTAFEYNVVNQITKITRPNGAYLQYTYDDGKRLTKVEDNTGASIEYDRNAFGNITARRIKNSGGTTLLSQTATFDELGRLLTFVGAASQTWTHAYDKTDNRVSVTDPRSNVYQRAFDPVNRLISETDEGSAVVTLTRNASDAITNYSDPRSLATSYVRNGFGDVIRRVSLDTGTTDYEYSAAGKLTKITDARSVVINLTYDAAGRLLTKQYPAATGENVTITWDATASGNKGKGRITKIEDASGSVEWFYNVLGHATQKKKTTASIVYTVAYVYDADGNVTQATYPSGRIVMFSRNSLGQISGVTTKKDSGGSTVTLASSVTYQPFGALKGLTYGNSLVAGEDRHVGLPAQRAAGAGHRDIDRGGRPFARLQRRLQSHRHHRQPHLGAHRELRLHRRQPAQQRGRHLGLARLDL